jgi:nucleotide-binding universal stress UspA family protein
MSTPVIVGFDGSTTASSAIRYGAAEAAQRGCALRIVHAFGWPVIFPPFHAAYDQNARGPRAAMFALLAQATRDVKLEHPHLTVTTRIVDGSPGGVLVDASRDAQLLVVGHRGIGGFAGLLAGSIGLQVAGHARSPVAVVRDDTFLLDAPVMAGIDGSAPALAAAGEAFALAHRRGVELFLAHHHQPSTMPASGSTGGEPSLTGGTAQAVHEISGRYANVKYRIEAVPGATAAEALIDAAQRVSAGLLVVGSRGHSQLRGIVMGSTSRSLIEHAPCPVMVVPTTVQTHEQTTR